MIKGALDILVEDLNGSLWVAALDKQGRMAGLEIDPYAELVRWGSIYWAKVSKIDTKLNAAFVDLGYEMTGMLTASDVIAPDKKGKKIGQLLRPGQYVMVQVKTARQPQDDENGNDARPLENKASRVSMDIALPGRFLVHTPLSPENRISRRIRDEELRKQLTTMLKNIDELEGCILRSSAAYCQTDVLVREGKILDAIWESLQAFTQDDEPSLLMLGPDAAQRMLSDFAATAVGRIDVADEARREEIETWCDLYAPELMQKIEDRAIANTKSGMGLFEARDLLGQIEGLVKPYVFLPAGGSLIIQETAAMTVIDVNAAGGKDPLSVNLEAADEIARQLRLRNLGGILMVDFAGNRRADLPRIRKRLQAAFDFDPCTVELQSITKLGLFEISRQRRTPSLMERVVLMQGDGDA